MKRTLFAMLSAVFALLMCAAGCSVAVDGQSANAGVDLVSVTVVHNDANGPRVVNQYWATSQEVLRAQAARRAGTHDDAIRAAPAAVAPSTVVGEGPESVAQGSSAISQVTCASGAFWLYNQTYCSGNVICFDGAGSADLTTYGYWYCAYSCYWQKWSDHAYSFDPGDRGGYLENTTWGIYQSFNANQGCTNTTTVPMQDLTLY